MTGPLPTILLLALPASGKSEIRRYLASLDPARLAADFRLGPLVHLDDFPYVHLMRRISAHLREGGLPPVFFGAPDQPMVEPHDWGTLIALLNADYADLQRPPR